MSTKKRTVKIGTPVPELPESGRGTNKPAAHWVKVAEAAKAHAGQWLPVQVGHLSVNRHREVPNSIKTGRLAAFAGGGFDAAFRDGTLYVKYEAPVALAVAR